MDERVDILTDDEVDTLILALLEGQGKAGATDEEMEDAVRWARTARFDSCLLDLVLDKRLVMRIDNGGGIRFVARAFALGVGGVAGSEHGATERPH